MNTHTLKNVIADHLPLIDNLLNDQKIPVFDRFMKAAFIFVEVAIVNSSFETKEELIKSKAFSECILPLINEWYWTKYGLLAKKTTNSIYSGIVSSYAQPLLIRIPSILKRVKILGESCWLTFPDCLHESESLQEMIRPSINFDQMDDVKKTLLKEEATEIISLTRSINLNIMAADNLDEEIRSMSIGIWSHFEKAISDILSFQNERASIGCWELHLAIEKTFKVFLKQKSGKKEYGHCLTTLNKKAKKYSPDIELSLLEGLPTKEDAIKLRYAELIRTPYDAVEYYKSALKMVNTLASKLDRALSLNNGSILVNMAPWAI